MAAKKTTKKPMVIIDTNAIIYAVEKHIYIINDLKDKGYDVVIPKQVISELEKIREDAPKLKAETFNPVFPKVLYSMKIIHHKDTKNTKDFFFFRTCLKIM